MEQWEEVLLAFRRSIPRIPRSVDTLNNLSINKVVTIFKFEKNTSTKDHITICIKSFQNCTPFFTSNVLSELKFNDDFKKFLWFLYHYLFESREAEFTSWVKKLADYSETSIVGHKYLGGTLLLEQNKLRFALNTADEMQVNQLFKFQDKPLTINGQNQHKLMRLTVSNCDILSELGEKPILFDLDKGTVFNLYRTLKTLGFPGLTCKTAAYKELVMKLMKMFCPRSHFLECKSDSAEGVNFFRAVEKTWEACGTKPDSNTTRFENEISLHTDVVSANQLSVVRR